MSIKYVAPSGNNALDGTSFATAYRDIAYGISQLKSGDKLMVYGTGATRFDYLESVINGFPTAAAWEVATRIEAAPGENVWLTPPAADYVVLFSASSQTYIDFNGVNIDGAHATYGGVKIEAWANGNPHHIRFQNASVLGPAQAGGNIIQGILCDSQSPGQIGGNEFRSLEISRAVADDFTHGIYIKSGGNIIDSCNIHTVTGACIHLYSTYPSDGNVISRNRLHDGRPTGPGQRHWGLIVTDNCPNTQVIANVVFKIPSEGAQSVGILVSQNAHGCIVCSNTVSLCPGVGMQMDPTVRGGVGFDNLSYGNGVNFAKTATNPVASHNLDVDPAFIDPAQNDFRILTSSAAARAGVSVPGVTLDALSMPYGNPPSVGAYEAIASPSGNTTSPSGTRAFPATGVKQFHTSTTNYTWTLGPSVPHEINRDGSQAAGATGYQIIWYEGNIYVQGDDLSWWVWTGSSFSSAGSSSPIGSDPVSSLFDASGNEWTIGSLDEIVKNGSQVAGAFGFEILWYGGNIYIVGDNFNWYLWTGSSWSSVGPTDPTISHP